MRTICFALILALAVTMMLAATAYADERVLQWDKGVADIFIHQEKNSHFTLFKTPAEWQKTFSVEVLFYGKRYGDVGDVTGTVVIWGPQTDKTVKMKDNPDSLVVYTRKNFRLADVPVDPAWVSIPIESLELPSEFAVAVYTYSNDKRGVELGLTAESYDTSHSASVRPEPVTLDELRKAEEKGKKIEGNVRLRSDGREWMIRLKVRPTLVKEEAFTSEQLTGDTFTKFDDGTAEEWLKIQKNGPMIYVSNPGKRQVDRIYVYGKVEGDWFNTDRSATVYILDSRFNIVSRGPLPYNRYTDEPSWSYASFTRTTAPKEFYVLVTPNCRPNVGLLLGYDISGSNQASLFGTPGAKLAWDVDAPFERTNWMIRIQYK
jgi:hypothetical protein